MTSWTSEELERIGSANELKITPRRPDATLGRPVPIWVVRVGDDLYVRSWRGRAGRWYRAAQSQPEGHMSVAGIEKDVAIVDADAELNDAIDEAYRIKYGQYPSYVEPMVSADARATTLRLVPQAKQARP